VSYTNPNPELRDTFMTRLTHLVSPINSACSFRFSYFGFTTRLSLRRAQNTLILAPLTHFSPPRIPKFTFSATCPDRPKPYASPSAMDPQAPAAEGEDFVHIENPSADESLSESIVNVEEPPRDEEYDEDVSTSNEAESSESRKVLPEELSRSVMVLTCESAADGGVCDVYLVGTAHVSQVMNRLCFVLDLVSVWLARKFLNWFLFGW
jgi:hypothetical protein